MNTITVNEGILEGIPGQHGSIFLGVPYAQPPLGALRFCAPQPPLPWTGIRPAKAFSARAWQMAQSGFYLKEFFSDPAYMPPMAEDCLYLNIWTPAHSSDEKLPVAFWLHGGAFINGFGSEMEFDGEAFARRGVILVTVNYRLGAFGFLASPELTAENGGVVGNVGILDQIAALRWLKANIAAFGGDPGRITIFGQSAGSLSCQTLASSPLAKGLFSGVILQSGGGYNDMLKRDLLPADAYATGEKFFELCGAHNLAELRALAPEQVMDGARRLFETLAGHHLPFYPILDGQVLAAGLNASIEQGLLHDVPFMVGSTLNDLGRAAGAAQPAVDPFNASCINLSLWLEKIGRKPAYVYYFTQLPQGDEAGAFHSSELWYVFGTLQRSWRPKTPGDYRVSAALSDYWTNFIKTGLPNGSGLPEWRPCSAADPYVQLLNEKTL
jgi:para-nitrobenzyl esterase